VIRQTKTGEWEVISKAGKRLGGPYKLVSQAQQRIRQIEHFKAQQEKKGSPPRAPIS
jgi:hypothetical protein